MKYKLYNEKGLTFKGALVIVLAAHVFGFFAVTQYKSFRAKLAREKWKEEISQKNLSEWNNTTTKPRIVAVPQIKQNKEVPVKNSYLKFLENLKEIAVVVCDRAVSQTNILLDELKAENKKTSASNKLVNLEVKQKPIPKQQSRTSSEALKLDSKQQEQFKRLEKALSIGKLKRELSKKQTNAPAIIRSIPPKRPVQKESQNASEPQIIYSKKTITHDGGMTQEIEIDETARRVIHTFY